MKIFDFLNIKEYKGILSKKCECNFLQYVDLLNSSNISVIENLLIYQYAYYAFHFKQLMLEIVRLNLLFTDYVIRYNIVKYIDLVNYEYLILNLIHSSNSFCLFDCISSLLDSTKLPDSGIPSKSSNHHPLPIFSALCIASSSTHSSKTKISVL